jgi:serine/threonine protein kinase
MVSTGIHTRAIGIWSLGIILYTFATRSIPFFHNDFPALCHQILSKNIQSPMTLSGDLIDLLKRTSVATRQRESPLTKSNGTGGLPQNNMSLSWKPANL